MKMTKLLILIAILAITCAAPTDKQKISLRKLFDLRMPYREPIRNQLDELIPSNVTMLTVTQRVDNFNPANLDTWEQRYLMNNQFYQPGAPHFLFLGGESAITDVRLTNSHMFNIARDLNASMLHLEHRFYGQSRPTE